MELQQLDSFRFSLDLFGPDVEAIEGNDVNMVDSQPEQQQHQPRHPRAGESQNLGFQAPSGNPANPAAAALQIGHGKFAAAYANALSAIEPEPARGHRESEQGLPLFPAGDSVLVANVQRKRNTEEFTCTWTGPWQVIDASTPLYREVQCMNGGAIRTSHVLRIQTYADSKVGTISDVNDPPKLFDLEKIIKIRRMPNDGRYEVFVKWYGFEECEASWEPLSELYKSAPEFVVEELSALNMPLRTRKALAKRHNVRVVTGPNIANTHDVSANVASAVEPVPREGSHRESTGRLLTFRVGDPVLVASVGKIGLRGEAIVTWTGPWAVIDASESNICQVRDATNGTIRTSHVLRMQNYVANKLGTTSQIEDDHDQDCFVVERILKIRSTPDGRYNIFVNWHGFEAIENSWESLADWYNFAPKFVVAELGSLNMPLRTRKALVKQYNMRVETGQGGLLPAS